MNSQWNAFLDSQENIQDSGAAAPDCKEILIDLSHLGMISISGEDAETFLQGQTTNDVRNVTDEHFQISACCTPKGRMLVSFIAFRYQQEIVLQLPRETQQTLLKRLPMFILMSKVKVADAGDRLVAIGLQGDNAHLLLNKHFSRLPLKDWGAVQENDFTLLRHPGGTQRFEVIGKPGPMIDLWKALAPSARLGSGADWRLENIRAGIPTVYSSTSEAFIPQMVNMQLVNGVSFTKGCYTGQEVVARTRYLGKVKRRMYLARIDGDHCPMPGDELFSTNSQSGQGAGKVVDAQASPEGGCEMLAVVEIERHDEGDVHIGSVDGQRIEFQTLPYSFEQN